MFKFNKCHKTDSNQYLNKWMFKFKNVRVLNKQFSKMDWISIFVIIKFKTVF